MSKDIAHNANPVMVPLGQGYNPTENPGIMAKGAQEPKGENAVNSTTPESNTTKYPSAKGSGY